MDIKVLIRYYGPYRRTFAAIMAVVLIQVVAQFLILFSVRPFIKNDIKSGGSEDILVYLAVSAVLIVLYASAAIAVSRLSSGTSAKVAVDLRNDLFRRIVGSKDISVSGTDAPGMMVRLMSDVDNVQRFTTEFFRTGVYLMSLMAAIIVASSFISLDLTFIFLLSFIIIAAAVYVHEKKEYPFRRELIRMFERCVRMFRDLAEGSRSRRMYGRMAQDRDAFFGFGSEFAGKSDDARIRTIKASSMATVIFGLVVMAVLLVHSSVYSGYDFDITGLALFVQLIILFETCLGMTPFVIETIPTVTASIEKIESVLRVRSETDGPVPEDTGDGNIVSSADGTLPYILRGRETSIVGPAGAGKSEFIHMMLLLSDVEKGKLFFEGTDLSEWDPSAVRRKVAYAGELALTFGGTLYENIDVWRHTPPERMEAACRAAMVTGDLGMHIERFAVNISLGEKHKISIARALASDADVYVFENCFMGLDNSTRSEIVSNIRSMLKGRTVIFTAQDTKISDGSDMVAVMDGGRLVAEGAPDDVMSCPQYAALRDRWRVGQ